MLSTINAALHGFVVGATPELTKGIRLNVVCPGLVEDSYKALASYFPGHEPVPMDKLVRAYQKCVEGVINGQVLKVY